MKHVLVTGGAGFVGSHLVDFLLGEGCRVTVFDNFDPFYDPALKEQNLAAHRHNPRCRVVRGDVREATAVRQLADSPYDTIVHLAARVGVRPSIADPLAYVSVNVTGTQNMLELARSLGVRQFIQASSSSVYGMNPRVPWREDDSVLQPISPYASTKVSAELLGHVYSHLYGIRFIALRFFTVYGPRQRPDLVIHKFARLMLAGKPVPVYGDGATSRDYTYVDDIVRGVRAAMDYDATRYEIINLGNTQAISIREMIAGLEDALGIKALVEYHPEQPGDVHQTWANVDKACALLGFAPATPYQEGVAKFVEWLTTVAPSPGL
jgi:UDP-glucuronate 4-epimerase